MRKSYCVYILTNKYNRVLYTGVTSQLSGRVLQHKEKQSQGFTSRYNVNKLVYYESFGSPQEAIQREKQIKSGSRRKKIELVNKMNPEWKDLFDELVE